MEEKSKKKIQKRIDTLVLCASIVPSAYISDNPGIIIGTTYSIYNIYDELKKFSQFYEGKPSLKNYLKNTALGWTVGGIMGFGIHYLEKLIK